MSKRIQLALQPYRKIVGHSFKHHNKGVFGAILGKVTNDKVSIEDYIPIGHNWSSLKPTAEVALEQINSYSSSKNLNIVGLYYTNEELFNSQLPEFLKLGLSKISSNSNSTAGVSDSEFKPILLSINPEKLNSLSNEVILNAYNLQKDQFTQTELNNSTIETHQLEQIPNLVKNLEDGKLKIWDFESSLDNVEDVNWLDQTI